MKYSYFFILIIICYLSACSPSDNSTNQLSNRSAQKNIAQVDIASGSASRTATPPCVDDLTLKCLTQNYHDLYSLDYRLFFKILGKYPSSIDRECENEVGKEYLVFVARNSFDGEVYEFIDQSITQAFVENRKCIVSILLEIDDYSVRKRIINYLKSSVFIDPKEGWRIVEEMARDEVSRTLFDGLLDK